ncbi:L-dopachrome tautomerase yellow-f2-like [Pieris rapae]|uniref:L-dopachrome tautomerase yellow-f2-like n=1 Tax=Pieris rapae TaxID=64459 RepID=UPI001E27A4D8|nr:L-dopachrome tautomerase yellow-f2-like [Pieris rapae]
MRNKWNTPVNPISNGPVTTPPDTNADANKFFIQYNNVPMGAEKVGHRLFIALPRRRYGIPATLNYIDLNDQNGRSPALKPYPNIYSGRSLISVYRTRAETCGRLWMVDTGLLELPGLASITVDITNNCADAYAYVPDLTTNGIIVYSLRDNDSWRITHNYFNFNPLSENLRVSGEYFQWSDGIFSIALSPAGSACRTAYFHPLISTQEFSISTCLLQNKTARSDRYFFDKLNYLGKRGPNSQSTMHDYHEPSRVLFFADIGRDTVSCWNTQRKLEPQNVAILAQDSERLSYPSDLHITDNEVWVIANKLPRFGYTALDTNEYNFYIYKANVRDRLLGTVCE